MQPFFSVIVPVYNVQAYLERCVRSVMEQSFTDYEMILVDDGSTDSSGELCDKLAEAYSCIRVIHKENGGLASARNAGMEDAQGQYIWFVDSDDWVETNALQRLYETASEQKTDMVKFNYIRVEEESTPMICNVKPDVYRGDKLSVLRNTAFYSAGKYVLSACTHIYRRDFLMQHGVRFVSERIVGSEDYLFNLETLVLADSVCVIADTLYYYEQRMGSLTQRYKESLPQRYEQLYTSLRESYDRLGVLDVYESQISAFYIWHLLRGTCIPNEYYAAQGHTIREGRRNIAAFLGGVSFQKAFRCLKMKDFSAKNRMLLLAMRMKAEPLFYWLYVKKPGFKKDKIHEI